MDPTKTADGALTVLGIETSCDETAAAIVRRAPDGQGTILSNVVLSQIDEHAPYGGVVPEIAARAHIDHLDGLVRRAVAEAGLDWPDLDGIAATAGPGLIGGVIVGLMTGKALAYALDRPLIAVNHLEGHALTARLTDQVPFPYLLLLVSGGHTQLLVVEGVGAYRRLGTTIDDAVGEAFDKVAKLAGLGYPGGPAVERLAKQGRPDRFALPRPLTGRPDCQFSFSGLKTAVRHALESLDAPNDQDRADLAASFQAAVVGTMEDRVAQAFRMADLPPENRNLVIAGGVAANTALRDALERLATGHGYRIVMPPAKLCTDNAAMIAWAGLEHLARGDVSPLDQAPRARWPLDPQAAQAGAKA